MTLSDYLSAHQVGRSAFAESIGVSRQALARYERGGRRPEWSVLERILAVTGGAVTPNDFIEIPSSSPPPVVDTQGRAAAEASASASAALSVSERAA